MTWGHRGAEPLQAEVGPLSLTEGVAEEVRERSTRLKGNLRAGDGVRISVEAGSHGCLPSGGHFQQELYSGDSGMEESGFLPLWHQHKPQQFHTHGAMGTMSAFLTRD